MMRWDEDEWNKKKIHTTRSYQFVFKFDLPFWEIIENFRGLSGVWEFRIFEAENPKLLSFL